MRFPHGHEGIYGVVTTNPCVGMLPFVDDDHVLLVRQWRYVIGAADLGDADRWVPARRA